MWSDELDVGGLVLGQKEEIGSSQPQEGTNSLTPQTAFLGYGKELNEREGRSARARARLGHRGNLRGLRVGGEI